MKEKNKYGLYNCKVYELGDKVELSLQTKPQSFLISGTEEKKKKGQKVFSSEEEEQAWELEKLRQREMYYKEKARDLKRTIQLNMTAKAKFVTLTFNNEHDYGIEDIQQANEHFSKFIGRLSYFFNKNKVNNKDRTLQYIASHELTKAGRVHYHMVIFNIPYLPAKKLEEIWRGGFVKINSLDNVEDKFVALYISKYIAKDLDKKANYSKAILSSNSLKRPEPHRINYDFGFKKNEVEDFKKLFNFARESGGYEWKTFDFRKYHSQKKTKDTEPDYIQKIVVEISKKEYEEFTRKNNLKDYQFWTKPSEVEKRR